MWHANPLAEEQAPCSLGEGGYKYGDYITSMDTDTVAARIKLTFVLRATIVHNGDTVFVSCPFRLFFRVELSVYGRKRTWNVQRTETQFYGSTGRHVFLPRSARRRLKRRSISARCKESEGWLVVVEERLENFKARLACS